VNPNGNGHAHAIRLTIPAKPEYITLGRLALTGIARTRDRPLSQELLGDLKLALTEACTNSVRHAYGEGQGSVEIVYELYPDKLVVQVADSGVVANWVSEVLGAHPQEVIRYKSGDTKLIQFFVGQVMKLSRGKADPKLAQRVLEEKLPA